MGANQSKSNINPIQIYYNLFKDYIGKSDKYIDNELMIIMDNLQQHKSVYIGEYSITNFINSGTGVLLYLNQKNTTAKDPLLTIKIRYPTIMNNESNILNFMEIKILDQAWVNATDAFQEAKIYKGEAKHKHVTPLRSGSIQVGGGKRRSKKTKTKTRKVRKH
uniref:Uncharacterized protein n=1 Tax=viral metagenome TaxID=1070528 RepID=A0A6C0DGW7_9ZZZZ